MDRQSSTPGPITTDDTELTPFVSANGGPFAVQDLASVSATATCPNSCPQAAAWSNPQVDAGPDGSMAFSIRSLSSVDQNVSADTEGASSVASAASGGDFSSLTTLSSDPNVEIEAVGSAGGHVLALSYDLATQACLADYVDGGSVTDSATFPCVVDSGEAGYGFNYGFSAALDDTGNGAVYGETAGFNGGLLPYGTPGMAGGAVTAAKPTITGTAAVGHTVSCHERLASGTTVSYAWLVSGQQTSTAASYPVPATAYGKSLRCRATVTNGATTASATSVTVSVTAGAALKTKKSPVLSGTPRAGKKIRVTPGRWSPTATSYRYQWRIGRTKVAGATHASFLVPRSDKGKKISCTVNARRTGYADGIRTTVPKRIT
jgi:hypothetical protein